MSEKIQSGQGEQGNSFSADDANIVRSPLHKLVAGVTIPEISFTDLLLKCLDVNQEVIRDEDWVVDVIKRTSFKFRDIEPMTRKIASALTRMDFKKGDVLYFVTYDMALIYMIEFAVWRCGGAVRGCFQREDKEEFERQMRQTRTRFILCDPETAEPVKWASGILGWPVHLLSIGRVEGATDVEEMIEQEDGSAFPHDVKINPKKDVVSIPNTSGSTGSPKGAMHTHYNLVALLIGLGAPEKITGERKFWKSALTVMGNFSAGTLMHKCTSIAFGFTIYGVSRFDTNTFLKYIVDCKPEAVSVYPYILNWLVRAPEVENYDLSYIKKLFSVGSVFDCAAAKVVEERLPFITASQAYASSETLMVAATTLDRMIPSSSSECEKIAGIKVKKLGEEVHMSCGPLMPLVEAKIMDNATGCSLGRMVKGNLWIRNPYLMKGYLTDKNEEGYTSETINGWLDTGDIAFFDEDGFLYIVDRSNFIFKYYMCQVSPAEIESVIGEHPAVLSVGVVGVPDPVTTSVARAYVVLKPGCNATEEEIQEYVAERKIFYKHLHGGVALVDSLPESHGGKLDRPALLKKALEERRNKGNSSL